MAEVVSENKFDTCLRNNWKIGETLAVHTTPSVEAMVAGSKWINEVLMVIFVVPPFLKKDGTSEPAAILLKTAASCSRQKLPRYDFPFPSDPRIKLEISQADASYAALDEVVKFLNKSPLPLPSSSSPLPVDHSSTTSPLLVVPPLTSPTSPSPPQLFTADTQDISDRMSIQLALSQPPVPPTCLPSNIDAELITQLAQAVSQQLNLTRPPLPVPITSSPLPNTSAVPDPPPLHSSSPKFTPFPSLHPVQDLLQSPRRHCSPSSSSDSRSSASSSHHSHVGKSSSRTSSGIFTCPFSSTDNRHFSHPHRRMKAKAEERKYLRRALHDFYSDFSTLRYLVDSIQVTISSTSSKPYASDLLWLQYHADYLDSLLLHMSQGPWVAWNELIVDKLTRSFLELLVRVTPNRAYPDFIDESVRKWMKRKRVGVCTQFGPIPSFLSDARVTDSGIQPKNGWENWRYKDAKRGDNNASSTSSRPKSTVPTSVEKK